MLTPASPAPCAHPHAHADPTSTNTLRDPSLHMMQPARNKFLQELQSLDAQGEASGMQSTAQTLCISLGDGAGKAPGRHLDFRVTEAREAWTHSAQPQCRGKPNLRGYSRMVPGAQCLQVICSHMVPSSQARPVSFHCHVQTPAHHTAKPPSCQNQEAMATHQCWPQQYKAHSPAPLSPTTPCPSNAM